MVPATAEEVEMVTRYAANTHAATHQQHAQTSAEAALGIQNLLNAATARISRLDIDLGRMEEEFIHWMLSRVLAAQAA